MENNKEADKIIKEMIEDLDSRVIPIMTHPLSRGWRQPSLHKLIFTEDYVLMDQHAYSELHNYETSYPSGVYEGKMWRSGGLLMWFDSHDTNKELCTVKSKPIAIIQP